ncbi:MAG: hypothetical protein AAGN66_01470 [Acidobacteriota bacterium]
MKTTLEIPDDVFRRSKAAAAMRGESLKDFVTESLRVRLAQGLSEESPVPGWRRVFGQADPDEIAEVDGILAGEFDSIDPDSWR